MYIVLLLVTKTTTLTLYPTRICSGEYIRLCPTGPNAGFTFDSDRFQRVRSVITNPLHALPLAVVVPSSLTAHLDSQSLVYGAQLTYASLRYPLTQPPASNRSHLRALNRDDHHHLRTSPPRTRVIAYMYVRVYRSYLCFSYFCLVSGSITG